MLQDSKVVRVPVYHFHDGFLEYTDILTEKYPDELRKIKVDKNVITNRFFNASRGWIKYKPLYIYLTQKNKYREKINKMYKGLEIAIPELNKLFKNKDFSILLRDLEQFDRTVVNSYKDYVKTNEIWNKLKK